MGVTRGNSGMRRIYRKANLPFRPCDNSPSTRHFDAYLPTLLIYLISVILFYHNVGKITRGKIKFDFCARA